MGRCAAGMVALLALASAAPAESGSPAGLWLTEDHRGVIEIGPCSAGAGDARLCGRIVGMAKAAPDGSPSRDFQGRAECGLEIIHALSMGKPGVWNGTITNPEDGKEYGARLSLDADGRLRLRGFLRAPLVGTILGSTQVWTPYAGGLTPDCRFRS